MATARSLATSRMSANVVDANLLAADAENVSGAVLNVATGRQLSVNDLADAVGKALGLSVEKEYLPQRAGEVRDSWADCGEAHRLLGYEPAVDLRRASGLPPKPRRLRRRLSRTRLWTSYTRSAAHDHDVAHADRTRGATTWAAYTSRRASVSRSRKTRSQFV